MAVAVPVAAWGLEQAAQRVEGRTPGSVWPGRLRQGADWLGGWGEGPLADRLGRPTTTVTRISTRPDDRLRGAEVGCQATRWFRRSEVGWTRG